MVINFNLLLVWLPMCKYTLTRLASIATGSLRRYRREYQNEQQKQLQIVSVIRSDREIRHRFLTPNDDFKSHPNYQTTIEKIYVTAKMSVARLNKLFCTIKIRSIGGFVIAVDHCKYLHTTVATTITIAAGE